MDFGVGSGLNECDQKRDNNQVPSTNHQIMDKIAMTKIPNKPFKYLFGLFETFGNWNLFGISDLVFGI
jgi:hypothetical protein